MYFFILYPFGLPYQKKIIEILKSKFTINKNLDLTIQQEDLNSFFFDYLYKNENKQHIYHKLQYMSVFFSQNNFKIKIILLCDDNKG